jgi:peptidoglycan hydrolase CwlO-like protein
MSGTSKDLAKGLIKKDPNIRTTVLSDKLLEELNKSEEKIKNYNQKANDLINKGVPQKEVEKFLAETSKYQKHIEYLKENITKAQKGEMDLRQAIKILSGPTPDKNFNNRTTVRDSLAAI